MLVAEIAKALLVVQRGVGEDHHLKKSRAILVEINMNPSAHNSVQNQPGIAEAGHHPVAQCELILAHVGLNHADAVKNI